MERGGIVDNKNGVSYLLWEGQRCACSRCRGGARRQACSLGTHTVSIRRSLKRAIAEKQQVPYRTFWLAFNGEDD